MRRAGGSVFPATLLIVVCATRAAALTDLVPTGLTPLGTLIAGQSLSMTLTISNPSATDATPDSYPYWFDNVYLSTDAVFGGGDTVVSGSFRTFLAAGTSYSSTESASIPNVAPGPYYLILHADDGARVT